VSADRVRLAELILAISLATDLGMGQPSGHALRTGHRAVQLARVLGLPPAEIAVTFYVALLRYLGCTADAPEVAALAGDEVDLARTVALWVMDSADTRTTATPVPDAERVMAASMTAHCEAAALLAGRLPLPAGVTVAMCHAFERWDGSGHPAGLQGREIPVAVRVAIVARDVELWERDLGAEATAAMLRARRGRAYDPAVVDACRHVELADDLESAELLAGEPDPRWVPMADIDAVLEVFADFADLKCPALLGHSRRVAQLAARGASVLGLDEAESDQVRRAGLTHDLGRVGVSAGIWAKRGRLTVEDRERIRMHPYHSERILGRCAPLAELAPLAGLHHERLDGSGYYRGTTAATLPPAARLLAAADACASAETGDAAAGLHQAGQPAQVLRAQVQGGQLDRQAVAAVLEAAGHPRPAPTPTPGPAGLTEREQQVLCLAARGLTIGQMAGELHIAAKTVDRHLQNSYAKIGVSSRAAAAVFAVSHGLVS
jgi:HD-GYP domain-containing protein (c-di-GMP phosphodiesterase class II)/DNA-binding CsgD family transcriptional regulator